MSEEEEQKSFISKIAKFLPAVEKPLYKQSFNARLQWTGIALLMYLVLSNITVFGIDVSKVPQLTFFEIVLGSKVGSLMTLGIGPIVTAGIILQLLVGSKIIDWDMTKSESKKKFQTWNKTLAIAFAFIEAIAYVLAGAIGPPPSEVILLSFVILQLAAGGVLVIFLDELVSKWGFGSGVSLFIAAGVAGQILIRAFSPLAVCTLPGGAVGPCFPSELNPPTGLVWNVIGGIIFGNTSALVDNLTPIIGTIAVFLLVIYVQAIRVEVPLAFSALRGFGRSWSLKLLYTSNVPVILTAALLANVQLMARAGMTTDLNTGLSCGLMGCLNSQGQPVSGFVYYLSSPRGLLLDIIKFQLTPSEVLRAFSYLTFLGLGAMLFSTFWVNTAGMDAKSVATQIESIGMQIPGYRRDPRIVESVLNRYIPPLAVLGGLTVGLLAAFADFLGAIGTGTGILLTVMIIYNYYEELRNQPLEEAHPWIRKIFGE